MTKKKIEELEKEINKKDNLSNDEKASRYKKRKILLVFIMIFGIATIVLSILSLVIKLNPIFAVISFIIEAVLSKYREKLSFRN